MPPSRSSPKKEVQLAAHDDLTVKQQASEPIKADTRAGDSVALLSIARSLNMWGAVGELRKHGELGQRDSLGERHGGLHRRKGRPREVRPLLRVRHQGGIPFEVKYLTAADELIFYSNTNSNRLNLSTGEYLSELTQLKRLTISAYGLTELDPSFKNLKNLEFLDLSGNNFEQIPSVITKENLPNLHVLKMNANQRIIIYDLYNSTTTNFGGLFQETENTREFPRRLLEWDKLDTLILSVNYLQGRIPDMKDYNTYTQEDINAVDTLPQALVGIPKVLPNIKRFSINLNRLTGELPEWLLRHPALDWWAPYTLIFSQEGKDKDGKTAGFSNEPINLNDYYEFYEGKKYLDPNKQ